MKKIGIILGIVVIAAVIGLTFAGSALGKAIKVGVETIGPKVTQTPVTLNSASLSATSGSGSMNGLTVGNPEGFSKEKAFYLGEISMDVDASSIFSDVIVIESISITEPEFVFEGSLGGSNLQKLVDNISEFTGPGDDAPTTEDGKPIKIRVKKLEIKGAKADISMMGVGLTSPLPPITLTDIGGEDGMESSELAGAIISSVTREVITSATGIVKDVLAGGLDIGGDVVDGAGEAVGDAAEKATNAIQGLFGD